MSAAAETSHDNVAAPIATVMAWRRFLNSVVADPAWFDDGDDWDDVRELVATENRRVAAEGRAIGFFAPGTPLDTDTQLVAAWRVMKAGWHELLEALPDGCRRDPILEAFLVRHGHEPAAPHGQLASLGMRIGLPSDATAFAVVVAAHHAAQGQALVAAGLAAAETRGDALTA